MAAFPTHVFETTRRAFWGGSRESIGLPTLVLGASYLGFGSLIRESGWSMELGLLSTITGWALPGQIAMVELYGVGAGAIVVALAVGLTNARLLPMVVSLLPIMRHPNWPRWTHYPISHLIAVTGWINAIRRCPGLPAEQRIPYFLGFTLTLWLTSMAATVGGFYLAGAMPRPVTLGLVFFNPLYFLLISLVDTRSKIRVLAIGFGVALGPALHLLTPDWGLLLTGILAGTAAFVLGRAWENRERGRHG